MIVVEIIVTAVLIGAFLWLIGYELNDSGKPRGKTFAIVYCPRREEYLAYSNTIFFRLFGPRVCTPLSGTGRSSERQCYEMAKVLFNQHLRNQIKKRSKPEVIKSYKYDNSEWIQQVGGSVLPHQESMQEFTNNTKSTQDDENGSNAKRSRLEL